MVTTDKAADARLLLEDIFLRRFAGRVAVVSSFGAESAVLLHLAASVDRSVPVLFLDTAKLFAETLRYRDALAAQLGLRDLRTIAPDPGTMAAADPDGLLWSRDPDACCQLRKIEPLARALAPFDAWVNGRKRFHGGTRTGLALEETADGRVKVNPLADWSAADIDGYFRAHALPRHPLWHLGYDSIGCEPCSAPTLPGETPRAGRWRGLTKTECGIHGPATTHPV